MARTGKPARFHQSTVSNLVEFLDKFEFRNVTDDSELKSRWLRVRRSCCPASRRKTSRSTAELRNHVQQGMAGIAAQLDTMIVRKGGRKFRLDD